MMKNNNSEAYDIIRWILDNADAGFFVVTASAHMQNKIAHLYKNSKVSIYDYSRNSKPYSYWEISEWANLHLDKDTFFILNMQLAFVDEKGAISEKYMLPFNMSRDLLADKQKIWIFFMTKEVDNRLSTFAYDIYSFVMQRAHFQDEKINDIEESRILEFDEIHNFIHIEETLKRYQEIEERQLKLPLEGTPDPQLLSSAITLTNIANLYKESLDYASALELLERVRIIREQVLGEEHLNTTNTYSEIALVHVRRGAYQEALAWYRKSLVISEKILGKDHLVVATIRNNIALVYGRQGDYQKALVQYQKSLMISEKILGKDHPDIVSTYNNIALIHGRRGDYQEALEWFGRALEISEKDMVKGRTSTAIIYNNTALVFYGQEDYFKALEWFQKALAISEDVLGKDHPSTATIYNNIGLVYDKQGDYQGALAWHQLALGICEEALGKDHPTTVTIRNNIANISDPQVAEVW